MYKFRDVTDTSPITSPLPSEAMEINGRYIERLVSGYRTLTVKGRELLSPELSTTSINSRDGEIVKNRRFSGRTIVVEYQLICADNEAFREAFNRLNDILNVADAKLIFADETDKFFIGTPSKFGDVPPGKNAIQGEFEILCADPCKYSVEEKTVTGHDGLLVAQYDGTAPVSPVFSVDFSEQTKGESGFMLFSDRQSHVVQIGDPKEADMTSHHESETVIDDRGDALMGWTPNANLGYEDHAYRGAYEVKESGGRYITPSSYGSLSSEALTGPSLEKVIPADSQGVSGATNFELSYFLVWCQNDQCDPRCLGTHECVIRDDHGQIVAAVELKKWYSGTLANAKIYAGGKYVHYFEFDAGYFSDWFGFGYDGHPPVRTISISKAGAQFRFNIGGRILSFTVPEGRDMKATKVGIGSTKYRAMGDTYPPMLNYFYWIRLRKMNVEHFDDIPNKLGRGDHLVADCNNGEITLNNLPRPDLGALGNDWETLRLVPGENRISYAHSAFTTDEPTVTMKYREAYR